MAPSKNKKRASSALDNYESDNSAADDHQSAKRPLKKTRTSSSKPGTTLQDDNGDSYWELSGKRRVTLSEFKGTRLVSLREYYESGGKELPGKKGISLSLEQYSALLQAIPEIEKELKKNGESVPRPVFKSKIQGNDAEGKEGTMDNDEDGEENGEDLKRLKKANFEATSDEDAE